MVQGGFSPPVSRFFNRFALSLPILLVTPGSDCGKLSLLKGDFLRITFEDCHEQGVFGALRPAGSRSVDRL